jgi:hypothetical protein
MTATEGRCWPLWSRTTKQASLSIDQGGGVTNKSIPHQANLQSGHLQYV